MPLVVQYSYSDTVSCTNSSLTKFTAYSLNTSCKAYTDGSYKTICSNGVYQNLQYSDAKCTNLFVTNSISPTGCQDGNMLRCVATPAPAPTPPAPTPAPPLPAMSAFDISFRAYGNDDCTGTILYTVGAVKNVCVAEGKGSYKFTCDNNIPTHNEYNSSTTCSGKASLSQTLSTTCSGPLR